MIADYYLVRRQRLNLDDLYSTRPSGTYAYTAGWNLRALVAFGLAAIFSISTVWVESLEALQGYAWLLGALLGAAIFALLSRGAKVAAVPARPAASV